MISKGHYDIADTYEELARAVFQCQRYGGPHGCAEASVYDREFAPSITELGKTITKSIVDKVLSDGSYSNEEQDELLDIRLEMESISDELEAHKVIYKLVDFLNNMGY